MTGMRSLQVPIIAVMIYLAIAAVVYQIGNHGTLTVSGNPHAILMLDGEPLSFEGRRAQTRVRVGEHRLSVKLARFEFETDPFLIERGQERTVRLEDSPGQLRAFLGQVVIGMDPRPQPSGPIAIQVSRGTYLRSMGKDKPVVTDSQMVGEAETFWIQWQNVERTEAFLQGQGGLYLQGMEHADDTFKMVVQRTASELFQVAWNDRAQQVLHLMTPRYRNYAGVDYEANRLCVTGRPEASTLFRLVSQASLGELSKVAEVPSESGGGQLRRIRTFTGHTGTISDVAISTDGSLMASASGWPAGDCTSRVWDLATGQMLVSLPHLKPVESVAISPDGLHVLTGREDVAARIYRIDDGQEITRFKGRHASDVTKVAYFPDGRSVVILCETDSDAELRVWDVKTAKLIRRIEVGVTFSQRPDRPPRSRCMALTPDGKRLVASVARTLKVWDTSTWMLIADLPHPWLIESIAVSPDGTRVLTSMQAPHALVRLLSVEDEQEIRTFEAIAPVRRMEFLPTGKHFVTCSSGKSPRLCVWGIEDGEPVASADLDNDYLCLAVTPDGRHVVGAGGVKWLHSLGTDLDIHLWQFPESVQP